tara:strand:+ start:524 stop:1081 length:558 start_codon:yes stop_codon:yes gene_type:complete
MKDKDNQFLFESYRETVEEGRKKKYAERERKTVIDPDTGEERKESYYEMMMRIKGIRGGAGARSRATRYKKASQGKVKLKGRKFKPAEKAYDTLLKGVEKDIIRYVENSPEDANDIINFASEYVDKAFAKKVVEQMILNGILDEVFEGEQPEPDVDPDKLGELEGHIEYDKDDPEVEVADELEDY